MQSRHMGRGYDQACTVAITAEVIGERWTLLIVRDLLIGPQRYNDLLLGLAGIPTNTLGRRLRDLEAHGVVERVAAPAPQRGVLYRLTPRGADLDRVIEAMAYWGAVELLGAKAGQFSRKSRPVVAALRLRDRLRERGAPAGDYQADIDSESVTFTVSATGEVTTDWGAPERPLATVSGDHTTVMSVVSGRRAFDDACAHGGLRLFGDSAAAKKALRRALVG